MGRNTGGGDDGGYEDVLKKDRTSTSAAGIGGTSGSTSFDCGISEQIFQC